MRYGTIFVTALLDWIVHQMFIAVVAFCALNSLAYIWLEAESQVRKQCIHFLKCRFFSPVILIVALTQLLSRQECVSLAVSLAPADYEILSI